MPTWNEIFQWFVPPGALVTLIGFAIPAWRRRRAGQLTRADNATRDRTKITRLYDYIEVLRQDAEARGYKPRAFPRGLKPPTNKEK